MSSGKWVLYAVFNVEFEKSMSSFVRTNLLVLKSKKPKWRKLAIQNVSFWTHFYFNRNSLFFQYLQLSNLKL